MRVKLASESSFNLSRSMGKPGETLVKGYFGFLPADTWAPNVNLYETETNYVVCVDLAGMDRDQIDLTVHEQRLRLKGKRAVPFRPGEPGDDPAARRVKVHLMEIDHGNFSREVELPADIDANGITASFQNGLLWIEVPKK